MAYNFPGNVRELQSIVLDAVSCTDGDVLNTERLQNNIGKIPKPNNPVSSIGKKLIFGEELPTLKEICEELTLEAMRRNDSNQALAASVLGISRQALNKRLNKIKHNNGNS